MGIERRELLDLPVSLNSWIILRRELDLFWEEEVFEKLIREYYEELPLSEVQRLFASAQTKINNAVIQQLLDEMYAKQIDRSWYSYPQVIRIV